MEHKGARELYELLGEHLRTGRAVLYKTPFVVRSQNHVELACEYAAKDAYTLAPEPKRRLGLDRTKPALVLLPRP